MNPSSPLFGRPIELIIPPASSHRRGGGLPWRGATVTVFDTNAANGKLEINDSPNARLAAMGKPINWTGEAYISAGPVDLPTLARYMDFPIETYAGRVDNAIWLQFTQGRVRSAKARAEDLTPIRASSSLSWWA